MNEVLRYKKDKEKCIYKLKTKLRTSNGNIFLYVKNTIHVEENLVWKYFVSVHSIINIYYIYTPIKYFMYYSKECIHITYTQTYIFIKYIIYKILVTAATM